MGFICSTKKHQGYGDGLVTCSETLGGFRWSQDQLLGRWCSYCFFLCCWLVFFGRNFCKFNFFFPKGIFLRNKFEVLKKNKNSGSKNGWRNRLSEFYWSRYERKGMFLSENVLLNPKNLQKADSKCVKKLKHSGNLETWWKVWKSLFHRRDLLLYSRLLRITYGSLCMGIP